MNISDAFPGSYLKCADLRGARVPVRIESVQMEDIGTDSKPVVYFMGKDRGLVLNKTNANAIVDVLGDDTDHWHGKTITLFPAKTDYAGKLVDCIRIDATQIASDPQPAQPNPVSKMQAQPEDTPF